MMEFIGVLLVGISNPGNRRLAQRYHGILDFFFLLFSIGSGVVVPPLWKGDQEERGEGEGEGEGASTDRLLCDRIGPGRNLV